MSQNKRLSKWFVAGRNTAAGNLIRVYFWAEDAPIAQMDTELTDLHVDHLNTPRIATNNSGTIVWQWHGSHCESSLPGQYFDKETNLHCNMEELDAFFVFQARDSQGGEVVQKCKESGSKSLRRV